MNNHTRCKECGQESLKCHCGYAKSFFKLLKTSADDLDHVVIALNESDFIIKEYESDMMSQFPDRLVFTRKFLGFGKDGFVKYETDEVFKKRILEEINK